MWQPPRRLGCSQLKLGQTAQEFVNQSPGKATAPAALLLLSSALCEVRASAVVTKDMTTKHADAGLPSLPAQQFFLASRSQTLVPAWPRARSQQNLHKISLWLGKMRREQEDVCSISFGKYRLHVWSGFIRLLVDGMARKEREEGKKTHLPTCLSSLTYIQKHALISTSPTCGVTWFSS